MKKKAKDQKTKWLFPLVLFVMIAAAGSILMSVNHLIRERANGVYENLQASVNKISGEEAVKEEAANKKEIEMDRKEDTVTENVGIKEDVVTKDAGIKGDVVTENGKIFVLDGKTAIALGMEAIRESTSNAMTMLSETRPAAEAAAGRGEEDAAVQSSVTASGKKIDWDALHKECGDIYAWIYVPGTTVDYPVLQHPADNNYYLNHNMDGSKGYPGCIYTENYNHKDFSDLHTVLYGHNLKDKTMFSSLHNFEKNKLLQEPHYIYVYTESGEFIYEVFAAYEFPAIHLLANYDLSNEYVYEQYIKDVLNMDNTNARVANIRHDIDITKKDKIITLSTCTSDHDASLRFLVVGVLLDY